jgi:hypothetical protein
LAAALKYERRGSADRRFDVAGDTQSGMTPTFDAVVIPGLACTGEGRCPRYPSIRSLWCKLRGGSRAQGPG